MTEVRRGEYEAIPGAEEQPFMPNQARQPEYRDQEVSVTVPIDDAAAEAESPEEYECFLAEICEPDVRHVPLSESPSSRTYSLPYRSHSASGRSAVRTQVAPAVPENGLPVAAPVYAAQRLSGRTASQTVTLDPNWLVRNRIVGFFPEVPEMEQYRVLRARVLHAAREKRGNAIMITSALPGEGKTLTAINLAFAFAKGYSENALLVDCDLRRQQIYKTLGFDGKKGLGDYLADGCEVSEMLTWPGVERLAVISGGQAVFESSEMLASPVMQKLVMEMKGRYDDRYVFFDVPPVLLRADALALAPFMDHILFVVRAGKTLSSEALRALRMLPKEKIIGVVLNEGSS